MDIDIFMVELGVVLLLLGIVGGLYAFFKWIETDAGRLRWDRIKLRLPIVGGIFERIANY